MNTTTTTETSLFEKIGGMDAVLAAVDIFYAKVLADDSINGFFDTTDMVAQKRKQTAFLAYAFGAPLQYTGKNMRDAHAPMVKNGLNESHFIAVATHLKATMEELNVAPELIAEVMKIAGGTKDDVLGL
ncbi:group I truncated hemoglobin [Aureivirga sp. CE67]|uniref:group I truncated hemoglobin n=1 Tax=Aureivirga sp. CE67 TaxID=1788983 RepID=UPI0018C989A7|nr:group 1 truncated hemoglobin [Aureivirga sp. CE67]